MVLYNVTSKIYELNAVPMEIWVLAGLLGIILVILSLPPAESKGDVMRNAIISFMAWIPLAFTALNAFHVDDMTGVILTSDDLAIIEAHTIYSFDLIGYLFALATLGAIVNTLRIVLLTKEFDLDTGSPAVGEREDDDDDYGR